MGGYPSAALGLRPVDALGGLEQGSRIQGQDLANQSQALTNRQQQQQMRDMQTTMEVLQKYNGNMGKALPELATRVSAPTYMQYAKFHQEEPAKTAEIDDKRLAVEKFKTEQLGGLISQASALPNDLYQQSWPMIVQKAHIISPELQLDPNHPLPQEHLPMMGIGMLTQDQYYKAEQEKRAAAQEGRNQTNFDSELPGKVADSLQKQKITAGTSPLGVTAEQQASQANQQATLAQGQQRINLEKRAQSGAVAEAQAAGRIRGEMSAMGGIAGPG